MDHRQKISCLGWCFQFGCQYFAEEKQCFFLMEIPQGKKLLLSSASDFHVIVVVKEWNTVEWVG